MADDDYLPIHYSIISNMLFAEMKRMENTHELTSAETVEIEPGCTQRVKTGFHIEVSDISVGRIIRHPKTNLPANLSIVTRCLLPNFNGEVILELLNSGKNNAITINKDDKLANVVIEASTWETAHEFNYYVYGRRIVTQRPNRYTGF